MPANDFELRRRRALYRATHRGSKELDFLLGRFAQDEIASMSEGEIETLERLIDVPDPEIAASFYEGQAIGDAALDAMIDALASLSRLRDYKGLMSQAKLNLPVDRLLGAKRAIASGVPEGFDALLIALMSQGARGEDKPAPILHIARDSQRLTALEDALHFFAPDVKRLSFPGLGQRAVRPRRAQC